MSRGSKKTFRDGAYYAHCKLGKRTIKQGECAAIWDARGERRLFVGPRRVWMWMSHVRFLSRAAADNHEYLAIRYRDGRAEHRRGPCAEFIDPCVHESIDVIDAYKLAANEALVVYRERAAVDVVDATANGAGHAPLAAAAAAPAEPVASGKAVAAAEAAIGKPASVQRRIVRGPAVYVPANDEWVHTFSWHGSPRADGGGSKTGTPNDVKVPHALSFQTLRCMPDQMYCTIRDVRTKDDAQISVHCMIFYELLDIEKMLDATNDPTGDFINALSADVMCFGAANTYESLLERTEQLSEVATFPTVAGRMHAVGYVLHKVVYRGYSTSAKLQTMHDDAIAKRTALRLQSATARVEQAEQAMLLRAKEERSQGEQALEAASARHRLELLRVEAEQKRSERAADHVQALRHEEEKAAARVKALRLEHDEDVRRHAALKDLGVDLTRLMVAASERLPDRHVRIDGPTGTAVHLDVGKR